MKQGQSSDSTGIKNYYTMPKIGTWIAIFVFVAGTALNAGISLQKLEDVDKLERRVANLERRERMSNDKLNEISFNLRHLMMSLDLDYIEFSSDGRTWR